MRDVRRFLASKIRVSAHRGNRCAVVFDIPPSYFRDNIEIILKIDNKRRQSLRCHVTHLTNWILIGAMSMI